MSVYRPEDMPSYVTDPAAFNVAAVQEAFTAAAADDGIGTVQLSQMYRMGSPQALQCFGRYKMMPDVKLLRGGIRVNGRDSSGNNVGGFKLDVNPSGAAAISNYTMIAAGLSSPSLILNLADVPVVEDVFFEHLSFDLSALSDYDLYKLLGARTQLLTGLLVFSKAKNFVLEDVTATGGLIGYNGAFAVYSGCEQGRFVGVTAKGRRTPFYNSGGVATSGPVLTGGNAVWIDGGRAMEIADGDFQTITTGLTLAANTDNLHGADGLKVSNVKVSDCNGGLSIRATNVQIVGCDIETIQHALYLQSNAAYPTRNLVVQENKFHVFHQHNLSAIDCISMEAGSIDGMIMQGNDIDGDIAIQMSAGLKNAIIRNATYNASRIQYAVADPTVVVDKANLAACGIDPSNLLLD